MNFSMAQATRSNSGSITTFVSWCGWSKLGGSLVEGPHQTLQAIFKARGLLES